MYVIGTAGHVDHGKSTLVKALTGIDPDRLREEKEREMTIVLGFAWFALPGGESVGVVDVPGHKDFIKNMLAGVGGIDAALLVIAADEGIMPQTREHLDILNLLDVPGGIIVLTKTDLVQDPEWLDLVMADVMEQVQGTCLENAPIVPVSARTGQGLEELKAEISRCLQRVPARTDRGRPRLPIDRVFTVAGFGTIVTGTLIGGTLDIGQEVEILPAGLQGRIRGLQTHKEKIGQAMPGSRVAVNLSGVNKEQVQIGDVLTLPNLLRSTQLVDVRLRYLAHAPKPLKHNTEVDFFCGAAQTPAHVRLLGADQIVPGETAWAQLRLDAPMALVRHDRFIIRWLSPSITVGGGLVIDPTPARRHRRFKPEVIARLETLAFGTPEELVLQALEQKQPCEARELFKQVSLPVEQAAQILNELIATRQIYVLDDLGDLPNPLNNPASSGRFILSAAGWRNLAGWMRMVLEAFHAAQPLRVGMPREELRSRLQDRFPGLSGKLFNQVIARAVWEQRIGENEASVWVVDHQVQFSPAQQAQIDALLQVFRRAPFTTPSVAECEAQVGEAVFNALVELGVLTRLSGDVALLSETVVEMRNRVVDYLRQNNSITVAQVRDLFDASRKYALALMEYLDEQRVTRRVGDVRMLR